VSVNTCEPIELVKVSVPGEKVRPEVAEPGETLGVRMTSVAQRARVEMVISTLFRFCSVSEAEVEYRKSSEQRKVERQMISHVNESCLMPEAPPLSICAVAGVCYA
jgi:hypothetical protein